MCLTDMHVHSTFSFDGQSSIQQECHAAYKNGLQGICFTEHFSMDELDVSYNILNYTDYYKKVCNQQKNYANKLWIGCGLEIGEPHLEKYKVALKRAIQNIQLDFIIGSIHNIYSKKLRLFMNKKNKDEIYQAYFQEILHMVEISDIDVIGHLDLAKRYVFAEHGNYDFFRYRETIKKILQCAIMRGIGIELNTSGWRNAVNETYPSAKILSLYKELGGKYITLGSDAHDNKNIGHDFIRAKNVLQMIGFKETYRYCNRTAIALPFD